MTTSWPICKESSDRQAGGVGLLRAVFPDVISDLESMVTAPAAAIPQLSMQGKKQLVRLMDAGSLILFQLSELCLTSWLSFKRPPF